MDDVLHRGIRAKRIGKSLIVAAAAALAMLIASSLPAAAASPTGSLIFFPVPGGPGGTYSCASGPPFVSELGSPEANCALLQSGTPAGLTCDIPTSITFVPAVPEVPGVNQYVADGLLCH